MFQAIINKLAQITKLDKTVNTAKMAIGAVEDRGAERLALKLTDGVVVLEEQGEQALLRQFKIPQDHFSRLNFDLKAQELSYFSKNSPRDIMLRTVQGTDDLYPAVRGVVSSRYSPFDNSDVLETIADELAGWEISSSHVGRDDMRLQATLPRAFDVSARQVGDTVRAALTISNNELGYGPAAIHFSLYRLVCKNGMTSNEQVAARVRHVWVDRQNFVTRLRKAVQDAGMAGEAMARLLRRANDVPVVAIDPDGDRVSREIVRILRNEGLYTQAYVSHINSQLGPVEPQSLFGAVQIVSDASRLETLPLQARQAHERAAGRMIQLSA